MEIPLLRDIVIIFSLSIVVVYVFHQIKLPVIVGLLLTGVLVGPYGLGLVQNVHEVEILAEVGVILLLFTIGIEFSLKKLMQIKTLVLVGGSLQVGLTILVTYLFTSQVLGWEFGPAMFMGFLLSLSSTAIVLKLYQERAEIESPQGRIALGILIFQDIIVVMMMLFAPTLAGQESESDTPLWLLAATGVALIVFVIVGAQYLIPAALHQIVKTRSRELFLLAVAGLCFAVAFITSSVGLSLALGAFLAGLTISESEYSHEAFEHILPFRDIFTSLFFVAMGMFLNMGFFIQQPIIILLVTLGVLVMKALIIIGVVTLLGFPMRTILIAGLGLSQVGEFSLILAKTGKGFGLIGGDAEQMFLAITVLTMTVTSFIIAAAPGVADYILRGPIPQRLRDGLYPQEGISGPSEEDKLEDHLVIIGFGINGKNVARAARRAGVPYAVLEMNPETVRSYQNQGRPVFYGDATQEAVLKRVKISQARTVVIVIAEATATRRITAIVRRLNPTAYIIARTRYVGEVEPLYELGANEVIPEEFETSVKIFSRVLRNYLVPNNEIDQLVAEIRADGYKTLRDLTSVDTPRADLQVHLQDLEISCVHVDEGSMLAHKTLAELDLRNQTGLTLLAIRREGQILTNIGGQTTLHTGDELFLIGDPVQVMAAAPQLLNQSDKIRLN